MYQEHAERILRLLHKSPQRGVITAAEATEALARSRDRMAQCERQAALRDALAQSGAMLEDAESRLAAHGEQAATERHMARQ
eukprot:gene3144-4051_t